MVDFRHHWKKDKKLHDNFYDVENKKIPTKVDRKLVLSKKIPVKVDSDIEIEMSEGKADIYDTSFLFIGLPGVGKSTLASGFEDVLVLVTSKKEVKRLKVPFILINTWEKMLKVVDDLINNRQTKYAKYKFIAIDFIDSVWVYCVYAVCGKFEVDHTSDAGYGKGVDTVDQWFRKVITRLVASDYGLILVSHVQEKQVFSSGNSITKQVCTLAPRARMIILPLINEIGCIDVKTVKQQNSKTGKIELVKKRVLSFDANEYIEGKDRDGVFPSGDIVLFRDPKRNFELLKSYYEKV